MNTLLRRSATLFRQKLSPHRLFTTAINDTSYEKVLLATTNEIHGRKIKEVKGMLAHYYPNNEKLNMHSAIKKLAYNYGCNAVIDIKLTSTPRFSGSFLIFGSDKTEYCIYGTGVIIE